MTEITLTPMMYMANNVTWLGIGALMTVMMLFASHGDGF